MSYKEDRIAEHDEHDALYHQDRVYKEIFDAMAKSLNIEKIAQTFEEMPRKKRIVKCLERKEFSSQA